MLQRYKEAFNGTLGTWNGTKVDLELKEGAKPCHAKAFPVQGTHGDSESRSGLSLQVGGTQMS